MAQQEEQQKQQGPIENAAKFARMGTNVRNASGIGRGVIKIGARFLAPAITAAAPFIPIAIAVIGVALVVIFVILVAVGIIGGGSIVNASPGDGLGIKDIYCQAFRSPEDLNGDGELNDCSVVLKGVILEAAAAAKMPAGVLNGIGLSENLKDAMILSESEITQYSAPGGEMPEPSCATSSAGARGPMQFLPSTFEEHKDFIVDVGVRPDGYESKICNIKDSLYAAAHKLKGDSGIEFDEAAREWTQVEVFAAARAYHGACTIPGFNYCDNVLELYNNKKNEGVGPGGLACYQFSSDDGNPETPEIPWTPEEQTAIIEAIEVITQSSKFVELVCTGGTVTITRSVDNPNTPNDEGAHSRVVGTIIQLRWYSNHITRVFVLTHESTHVIQGTNAGFTDSFISSGTFENDGGIIRSYPLDLGCALDGDVPPQCYRESMAEAAGWYVVDGSFSFSGGTIVLASEYPAHNSWVSSNIFGGHVFTQ